MLSCFSRIRLLVTPWIVACQAPLSVGFFRQEYWSRLPFPSPGNLSNPGIEPASPVLQVLYTTSWVIREAPYRFQFSCSVMSDSLWPHGLQHTRLSCPSPTPSAYSNSCASTQWCHPTISSSVVRFSSCPQSLPASESFPMSQFFTSGGQSIRVSASASVPPMNIQERFPLKWTG